MAAPGTVDPADLDTSRIREWRSIVTLIVFVLTNVIVLFPFHISIYVPSRLWNGWLDALARLRVIAPRQTSIKLPPLQEDDEGGDSDDADNGKTKSLKRLRFPMNFITAPLIADLFLLAISAIGRDEVYGGTVGANNIQPINIMAFFITLAYIAISIDASGAIRYLAFKVLQWGGKTGRRLFFFLYAFFFALGSFVGNDPIILSGTAFLAYMTRVSSNIKHPRAWIYSQFAVANIASAILVSSNPTNLVLAGAFSIKFIDYTANMIVPVIITALVLFPFLLYIVFNDENFIPSTIKMHELPDHVRGNDPINPNIPNARGIIEDEDDMVRPDDTPSDDERQNQVQLHLLEEIMNPFLDKGGAGFGALIMAATLVTILAVNASNTTGTDRPVFWITVPAAFVMLVWDLVFGWRHRKETREMARTGQRQILYARAERAVREEDARLATRRASQALVASEKDGLRQTTFPESHFRSDVSAENGHTEPSGEPSLATLGATREESSRQRAESGALTSTEEKETPQNGSMTPDELEKQQEAEFRARIELEIKRREQRPPSTFVSLAQDLYRWCQETFPTVMAVMSHLPFALVPFVLCMFVLVQGLVTKGWVPVFAYGWDHWVNKTGTIGAIGGMGFLSVVLCNFAGTNIGTTILLSRVIQEWCQIHTGSGEPISERTFWATVYAMALGVNYGAFSSAFSASLAGLLWRDILSRKHIRVPRRDFARVNMPIIAISMTVGCLVLIGEVYITRSDEKAYVE